VLRSHDVNLGVGLAKQVQRTHWLIVWLATLAIAAAQLGAVSHAYSHLPPTLVGHVAGATVGSQSSNPGDRDYCGDCLSFAPLLSMGGITTAVPNILPLACAIAPNAVAREVPESPLSLAFRSRAPPTLA